MSAPLRRLAALTAVWAGIELLERNAFRAGVTATTAAAADALTQALALAVVIDHDDDQADDDADELRAVDLSDVVAAHAGCCWQSSAVPTHAGACWPPSSVLR